MPRGPLPWLLAAEAAVLLALGVAGWRLVTDRLTPPPSKAVAQVPAHRQPTPTHTPNPSQIPPTPPPKPTAPKPSGAPPGLTTNPAFWQRRLTQINRDEATWEVIEARAVKAVEAFARAYIDQVVLPAVRAAAHESNGP